MAGKAANRNCAASARQRHVGRKTGDSPIRRMTRANPLVRIFVARSEASEERARRIEATRNFGRPLPQKRRSVRFVAEAEGSRRIMISTPYRI